MASRFAPLSDEAKARTLSNRARIAALVGVDRSTVTKWRVGRTHPSYDHVVAMLGLAALDGLSLEDFGYTERPDGRVARLLAPGHKPAPNVFRRADGRCVCNVCGSYYRDHPVPVIRGHEHLHVLCDGWRVKL
jgi:hypothetical protein